MRLVKQLVLDLIAPPAPSFDNFIPGQNREAMLALRALSTGEASHRLIYCWGAPSAGKTHLVVACSSVCAAHAGLFDGHGSLRRDLDADDDGGATALFVVDDVQKLDDAAQVSLFNLINSLATFADRRILVTGNAAPRDLALRPELASRLGSELVFQLQPLSDAEKSAALEAHAAQRGFGLRDDVRRYLLRHTRRDMRSLMQTLDALDQYSLETGREITLPLVREMAQPTLV